MRLTTKGRFAVTALLDLALNQGTLPVSLADISKRQDISLSYLEQLFGKLKRAELVQSLRGPGGGYFLNREASEISVLDIIIAAEDSLDATQCHGSSNCHQNSPCITHELWTGLNDLISNYLSSVSLKDLVLAQDKQPERETKQYKNYNMFFQSEAEL